MDLKSYFYIYCNRWCFAGICPWTFSITYIYIGSSYRSATHDTVQIKR